MTFEPKRVFFEKDALEYEMGKRLYKIFRDKNIEVSELKSHNRVTEIPGNTPQQAYFEGKNTLVVGVRHTLKFQSCKPSAHYQLPLVTSCMGMCTYCYLNTQLGKKPYIRVYVNIDEILNQAEHYIKERKDEITLFEGAATSDPIPTEPYTGALRQAIEFFGRQENGRFRFVTKFTEVDSLLDAKHNDHTTIRFSINAAPVIQQYEHRTPGMLERIEASYKIIRSGYQIGFIIAPVLLYDGWEKDYSIMISELAKELGDFKDNKIHFEIISHRFTAKAKNNINEIFPNNNLPMNEEERKFKYGQFGYGKYIYNKEQLDNMKSFFIDRLKKVFSNCEIDYII